MKGGVGIGSQSTNVKKAFPGGSAYRDSGGNDNLVYDGRGIAFVLNDDRVHVIQVYRPR
jgi:hypothetical protein